MEARGRVKMPTSGFRAGGPSANLRHHHRQRRLSCAASMWRGATSHCMDEAWGARDLTPSAWGGHRMDTPMNARLCHGVAQDAAIDHRRARARVWGMRRGVATSKSHDTWSSKSSMVCRRIRGVSRDRGRVAGIPLRPSTPPARTNPPTSGGTTGMNEDTEPPTWVAMRRNAPQRGEEERRTSAG